MEYTTSKTVTDLEFETVYHNDDINIDTELNIQFRNEHPDYNILGTIGYLTDNGDGTKTYNITFTYEVN
jgi:hypothetical protein